MNNNNQLDIFKLENINEVSLKIEFVNRKI